MYDRRWIAKEAHRQARIFHRGSILIGKPDTYAKCLATGMRKAWAAAKEMAEIDRRNAAMTAEARARRDEAVMIHCSTDGPLSAAANDRLHELARAA